jgi:hypothetical protein
MRDKNEKAVNDENKEFEKSVDKKTELFDLIKETLINTTEKEFKKQGFEPVEGAAGMYGNEETYGAGTKPEQFSIKVSGKTLPSLEKTIQLGGKRLTSEVKCIVSNGRLKVNYNTPENTGLKNFIVRKELSISTGITKSKAKKQLEEMFSEAAMFEVNYLKSASLGTEYGSQNYYNPNKPTMDIINNKLTIKEIFASEVDENFQAMPDEEQNLEKIKEKNTVETGDGKDVLLDKTSVQEISEKLKKDKGFQKHFKETLNRFGAKSLGEIKNNGKDAEFLQELYSYSVSEITSVGAGAGDGVGGGAGAYLTPFAFAKPGSKKKGLKEPFVEIAPEDNLLPESKNVNLTKDLKDTNYFKGKGKRPKVDKDWNIISEAGGDPYTIAVKVDPNTHPQGMPFIKPGSEEEARAAATGDPDKLKRIGVKKLNESVESVKRKIESETEADRIKRLGKKRFNSILENEQLGVNKRYIITEKTTKEYEKERMSRLAGFKLYETIKDAENLSEVLGVEPEIGGGVPSGAVDCSMGNPNLMPQDSFEGEGINNVPDDFSLDGATPDGRAPMNVNECIEVEKPGSMFGLMYKFKKEDFLNESKKYILDLNSMVFVPNPGAK